MQQQEMPQTQFFAISIQLLAQPTLAAPTDDPPTCMDVWQAG